MTTDSFHGRTGGEESEDCMTTVAEDRVTERYEDLPIHLLVASKTNPRTHFDDGYLAELARSIAEKGLIQPIVVRPNGSPGTYEIVAGECRYRASKLANLPSVPAIIRVYTDEQTLEIQLIENIHRTDLTPLERARGYRRLIDTNPTKHTAESIAGRIGMSPAWVWDTMKLLDLIPDAQQLLEDERISAGHAILLARLKPEQQERVIDREKGWLFEHEDGFRFDEATAGDPHLGLKPRSVRELQRSIAEHIRFDVVHAAQAAPLEFEHLAKTVETRAALPGRGKKVIAITFDSFLKPDAKDESERTYTPQSWRRADGTETYDEFAGTESNPRCEFSVLGVVAVGDHYGEAFDVCIARDKCRIHWGKEMRSREKTQQLRDSGQTAKAAAREAAEQEKIKRERDANELKREQFTRLKAALARAADKRLAGMKVASPGALAAALKRLGLPVVVAHRIPLMLIQEANRLAFAQAYGYFDEPRLRAWVKDLGLDLKALERTASAPVQTSGVTKTPAKKPATKKPATKGRRRR